MRATRITFLTIVATTLWIAGCTHSTPTANSANADPNGQPPPAGEPGHGPHGAPKALPEEAYTACTSKKEGDACTTKDREGNDCEGECHAGPPDAKDSRLACMPKGGPGRPEHEPKQ
ncbi:MAG: hypothetical protein QM784_21125 [Polyangiaceae bacterium]